MTPAPRPVMLVILDGFGLRTDKADNAVALARTPILDRLTATCPTSTLVTSGLDVGLPVGQMGNSEVGHLNIGAGRVVMQELPRITLACMDGSLSTLAPLRQAIDALRASGGACHLLGLVSDGGVHSHQDHGVALAEVLVDAGIPVVVHALMDGRDTPPRSGRDFLAAFQAALPPRATIGTVCGRFFAMDRDQRWDRVGAAYAMMVEAEGAHAKTPLAAVEAAYAADTGDEFVPPTVVEPYAGMKDGDGIVCFNFRADRVREMLDAFLQPDFAGFFTQARAAARGRSGDDGLQQRPHPLHDDAVRAAEPRPRAGRGGSRRRQDAAAHGREREISPCHLFPERRPRGALPGRAAHPGALAESRDLRPAARDVGPRTHRQGGRVDRERRLRPDRPQLRQPRHGRPYRRSRGRH